MSRLPVVRRLRALVERRALGESAAAERRVRDAEADLERRRDAYLARPLVDGPVTPLQLRALELTGLAAGEDVTAARDTYDDATEQLRDAAAALSGASVRRKSVDRLHERREAERSQLAREAAQRSLDELATLRHGRPTW